MKRTLISVFTLGFCVLPSLARDATATELKKLQGDWAAFSLVVDGVKSSDDEAQCLFRTVKGNSYTIYLFKKPLARYRFTIDATKQLKTIDITPAERVQRPNQLVASTSSMATAGRSVWAPPARTDPRNSAHPKAPARN